MNIIAYSVNTTMEPKRRALRLCNSLGGTMEPPRNESELKDLGSKLALFSGFCPKYFWVPIFKGSSDESWLAANKQKVKFVRWRRGQPNGGNDYEKCAGIAGIGTEGIAYFDTNCGRENCFIVTLAIYNIFKLSSERR